MVVVAIINAAQDTHILGDGSRAGERQSAGEQCVGNGVFSRDRKRIGITLAGLESLGKGCSLGLDEIHLLNAHEGYVNCTSCLVVGHVAAGRLKLQSCISQEVGKVGGGEQRCVFSN